jgi:hypothetical protein
MSVAIVITSTPLFRIQLDQRIDTHDGDTSFHSTLQLFHLAHAGLQSASFQAIMYLAVRQVQTVVLVSFGTGKLLRVLRCTLVGGSALRQRVSGPELCDELGAVFRGVYGESLGDTEQGCSEGGNG